MKGRLIGREGRNIRAIEAAMGVDLIIDDVPESVTISCFDPIRREVAKVALEQLIVDGRIHPARVEGMVDKARREIDETVRKAGQQAVFEANIKGLHTELVKLMGRLKYRTSYGENVLRHSIEVSLLSGLIAAEVGANVNLCKVAGFLHDIGKGFTHEIEGPHAEIGADIVAKYGVSNPIQTAIREHHDREMTTVASFVVAAADAISAARPGARHDSIERYIQRLEALEEVARGFDGVERCFAIQAGREMRVMVSPDRGGRRAGDGSGPRHRGQDRRDARVPRADQGWWSSGSLGPWKWPDSEFNSAAGRGYLLLKPWPAVSRKGDTCAS